MALLLSMAKKDAYDETKHGFHISSRKDAQELQATVAAASFRHLLS